MTGLVLNGRDRPALRLGAWIVAPALVLLLVVQPYRHARREALDALAGERRALSAELAALRDAPIDARLVRQARDALVEERDRLFDGADAMAASAELASWVADQAAESGLTLEDSETRAPASDVDNAAIAGVEIRAAGDVLAVVAFLRALENGPRLARVERMTIAPPPGAEEGDGSLVMAATITGLARRATGIDGAPAGSRSEAVAALPPGGRR